MMENTEDDLTSAHMGCCLSTDYPVSSAIIALARSHRTRAASLLSQIGLFPGQEMLLIHLGQKDGEPQKSLCDTFRLDHSTVAKSLTRLERCGLIERRKCLEDGRVTQVYLTDKGRATREAILRVRADLEAQTVARLTPDEQAELVTLSGKILAGIE